MRRKSGNICGYWDCNKRIPDNDFLCTEHHKAWADGLLDQCPKCSRFKDIMYQLCLDCYFGRRVAQWKPLVAIPTQKQAYKVEYSDAWVDGHLRPDRFFVYVLQFDEGYFHVGHTADLRERLAEHGFQKKSPAAGRNPQLQYLQIVATQKAAELREDELKKLIESNPDQVRLMISHFRDQMRELGLE